MKYYNLQELMKLGKIRCVDDISSLANIHQESLNLIKPFIPELQVYYICWEDDKGYYIDGSVLMFERKGIKFHVIYRSRYGLSILPITRYLKNISMYDLERIYQQYEKPNNIKILSQKKVDMLIAYHTKAFLELEKLSYNKTAKIEDFKNKLKIFPEMQVLPENFIKSNFSGEIIRNGLVYDFEVEHGNIYTKVKVYFKNEHNISPEDFKALSDNRFLMKK